MLTGCCVDNLCGPIRIKGVLAPSEALSSHFKAFPLSTHLSTTLVLPVAPAGGSAPQIES